MLQSKSWHFGEVNREFWPRTARETGRKPRHGLWRIPDEILQETADDIYVAVELVQGIEEQYQIHVNYGLIQETSEQAL